LKFETNFTAPPLPWFSDATQHEAKHPMSENRMFSQKILTFEIKLAHLRMRTKQINKESGMISVKFEFEL